MLFSRNLILKLIPDFAKITNFQLIQALNSLGMELEAINKYQQIKNCVIGQLLKFEHLIGTDHLNVCQVKIGNDVNVQIICGANNLVVNKKVIVALPGAVLPNNILIEKKNFYGKESNGMLCSYAELSGNDNNLISDEDKQGIIILNDGDIGSSQWQSILGLDDVVYDISVPNNRNDENSYLVFCYELANKLGLKFNDFFLKILQKRIPHSFFKNKPIKSDLYSCLCFFDYFLERDQLKSSDWSLKAILISNKIKPINAILDKLAYITLLTNCPIHVYDANNLYGGMICKLSQPGIKFFGLNGRDYLLAKNDLVICDQNQPVALASIIGSENTKLTNKTAKIRIEIGNFCSSLVRNTALSLNLETLASKKAAHSLSTFLNFITIELIKNVFNQNAFNYSIQFQANWPKKAIDFSYKKLQLFINKKLSLFFINACLKKLGYSFSLIRNKIFAPKWRLDVKNQEDIFEDFIKIIDINNLEATDLYDKLLPLANNVDYELKQKIKNILLNNFFWEVKTYNLTNKQNLEKFNFFNLKNPIHIQSHNSNREFFRINLIDGLLNVYKYNQARKLDLLPIFEMQKIFNNDMAFLNLSMLCLDNYCYDNLGNNKIITNVNYLKAIAREIAFIFNRSVTFVIEENIWFYNNEALAIICDGKHIGFVGKIRSACLKEYDLSSKNIYCLSVNLDYFFGNYSGEYSFKIKPFGVFQSIFKDTNVILTKEKSHLIIEIINKIKQIPEIKNVKIIKLFNKEENNIYTLRYYLIDNKQFSYDDISQINIQIEKAIKSF